MSNREQRRQLIVSKPLQRRIVLEISAPIVFVFAFVTFLLGGFCLRLSDEALQAGVVLPSLLLLFLTVGIFIIATAAALLHVALRTSHRIAGPAQRIRSVFQRVESGDLDCRVSLRKTDYLDETAADVNQFLDWVQEQVSAAKTAEVEQPAEASAAAPTTD
jgi:HAMP domain-containing protein